MTRRTKLFAVVAGVALVLDQLSKAWARHALLPGASVPLIPGYWDWQLSYNTGAAFGLLRSVQLGRILLSAAATIAAAVIIVAVRRLPARASGRAFALALVFGGAVGNLIDRVWLGHVTDFILWKLGSHRWQNFNVADAALVVGILLLLVLGWKTRAPDAHDAAPPR